MLLVQAFIPAGLEALVCLLFNWLVIFHILESVFLRSRAINPSVLLNFTVLLIPFEAFIQDLIGGIS